MIYPDVSVEEWLQLYAELKEDYSNICEECGTSFSDIRPFIDKDYRGIQCECTSCDERVIISQPYTKEKIK